MRCFQCERQLVQALLRPLSGHRLGVVSRDADIALGRGKGSADGLVLHGLVAAKTAVLC